MNQGRIIVITGSPGTGKTTTASIVAKESDMDKSVHMHTDDFFHYLSKGAIPPHLPESNKQNLVVIEAFLEAAKRYARGGYDVIVDGIVGPWFLEPWKALAQEDYEVHYIVLRASKKETMKRAVERSKLDRKRNDDMDEDNIITLNDENGNEVEFEFLDLIPYRQNEYVVLLPIGDSDGQVVILQLKEIDDETEEYVGVENEFVLETVFALFKERNKDFFTSM